MSSIYTPWRPVWMEIKEHGKWQSRPTRYGVGLGARCRERSENARANFASRAAIWQAIRLSLSARPEVRRGYLGPSRSFVTGGRPIADPSPRPFLALSRRRRCPRFYAVADTGALFASSDRIHTPCVGLQVSSGRIAERDADRRGQHGGHMNRVACFALVVLAVSHIGVARARA